MRVMVYTMLKYIHTVMIKVMPGPGEDGKTYSISRTAAFTWRVARV